MSFNGREIANFVLDFCESKRRPVTNLALQKIVYFCHVWSLIDRDCPLVRHKFEAWEFGPVLQYLYRDFRAYDRKPIASRAKEINRRTGELETVKYDFDDDTSDFLSRIVEFYSRLAPGQLVELSHCKDGPWDRVWNHSGLINPGMKIDDNQILEFYTNGSITHTVQ